MPENSFLSTETTFLVKIGGSVLSNQDSTLQDLVYLQQQGHTPILVHGGGQLISDWMQRQGTTPRFLNGLRITDSESMDIVTAILSGLVNKTLVASIQKLGGKAIGMSGVDGKMLEADILDPELGYVGRITKVNTDPIKQTLRSGYMPVIAPLAICGVESGDQSGILLNVNGDTAAGEIGSALASDAIIFLTDVSGIMDSESSVLNTVNSEEIAQLIRLGTISGGMIPKVQACLRALGSVPIAQIIDGRKRGALLDFFEGVTTGTRIELAP